MPIASLNPYLNFDGSAVEAIKLYQRVLGAKVENQQTFGEVPGMEIPPDHKQRIMHAQLAIGGGKIMISDGPPGWSAPKESNAHIALHFDAPAEMNEKFDALAAGGKVTMPLQDTFWGAKFGMLTDRYGIQWMFNCELKGS